jgi:hypothetical protein
MDYYRSFKEFLANPTDKASILNYQRVCQGVTLSFKEISEGVREVEQELLNNEYTKEYAAQLRNVQNLEREKLQNTVAIQRVIQQMAQEQLRIRKDIESEELLRNHIQDLDSEHIHNAHCQHHDEEVIRGERLYLLEQELKRLKFEEGEIIVKINEQLEEIRYIKADLRELYQEQKLSETNMPVVEKPGQKEETLEGGIYL